MIQRIQSLFILGVIILNLSQIFAWVNLPTGYTSSGQMASLGLAIVALLGYSKRPLQILVNNINMILNILLIVLMAYFMPKTSGGNLFPEKAVELSILALIVLLLYMANRNIKKDDRLVKSVDRLR